MTEVLEENTPASVKPRTASLLKAMDLDSVTLDDALRLLTLPRTVGEIDGESVIARNGRYGPYVQKGADSKDSRSLESEDQLFTLTLDQARELFAQPKQRGRAARAAAAPPLRELGDDTASGKPMVVREGRFGPYVTDGETNASLRKGERHRVTLDRAAELLAERRARGPATASRPRRAPARRPPKKTRPDVAAKTAPAGGHEEVSQGRDRQRARSRSVAAPGELTGRAGRPEAMPRQPAHDGVGR